MRAEGMSYRGIAVRLDEEGIRPKRGKRWIHTTVKSILVRNAAFHREIAQFDGHVNETAGGCGYSQLPIQRPNSHRVRRVSMRSVIVTFCVAIPLVFVVTWKPVVLVPLISGLIALVAYCLKTRGEASARLTDPDYDRKMKEATFRFVVPGLGAFSLLFALISFVANGWSWSLLWCVAFSLYSVWFSRWGLRQVRRQNPPARS
jgi:hypothetical protein